MLFFRILQESILLAITELRMNKLRAFLSLLGITIGIFCVISVLTSVDNLKQNVSSSIEKIGKRVLYVQKWPWDFGNDYAWWDYLKRPSPGYNEFRSLQDKLYGAEALSIQVGDDNMTLEYKDFSVDKTNVIGVSHDFAEIYGLEFSKGRYFSLLESYNGNNVMIIGAEIAEALFPNNMEAVGRYIKMSGFKYKIIGVLEKEGESLLETGFDERAVITFNNVRKLIDIKNNRRYEAQISIKAKENVSLVELEDEIRGVMRSIRKLKPKEEDNFAINKMTIISSQINGLFGVLNLAGWIIGGFAILVGGFGIANIMFVSVRERTNIIGIKKAIGAKRYVILLEFIFESIMLCIVGGLLGLVLVLIETVVANNIINDFTFYLTAKNVILGLVISIIIGVISGFWPALTAARMNPVDAIRYR